MSSTHILVSREIAAESLSISTVTLDRLVAAKKIKPTRIGRRVLFSTVTLAKFARECGRVSQ